MIGKMHKGRLALIIALLAMATLRIAAFFWTRDTMHASRALISLVIAAAQIGYSWRYDGE